MLESGTKVKVTAFKDSKIFGRFHGAIGVATGEQGKSGATDRIKFDGEQVKFSDGLGGQLHLSPGSYEVIN